MYLPGSPRAVTSARKLISKSMSDALTRFRVTYADVVLPQPLTQGDGDSLSNDLELSDTEQYLVLSVTLSQYTKLLSAALNGANRYYPDEYIEVIYPLIKAAKVDSQFCAKIAECIENQESATYEALHDWLINQLTSDTDVQNAIAGTGVTGTTPIAAAAENLSPGCDLDLLFGFTLQLTQLFNNLIEQLFQTIEAATNLAEAAMIVTQQIPVVGQVAAFFNFLLDLLAENYALSYDVEYEYKVACGLFCLAQEDEENCDLTWEQITEFFANRLARGIADFSIHDMLSILATGTYSGDEYCDVAMLVLTFLLRMGADWAGVSLASIKTTIAIYHNDSNSDWETACTECGWYHHFDFRLNDGGWVIDDYDRNPEEWVDGEGWYSLAGGTEPGSEVRLRREFDARVLTELKWRYSIQNVSGTLGCNIRLYLNDVQQELIQPTVSKGVGLELTVTPTYTGMVDEIFFTFYIGNETADKLVHVSQMWVGGEGTDPFA